MIIFLQSILHCGQEAAVCLAGSGERDCRTVYLTHRLVLNYTIIWGPDHSDCTATCSGPVATVYINSSQVFYQTNIIFQEVEIANCRQTLQTWTIKLVEFVFVRMMTVRNSQIVMLSGCNVQVVVCGFMCLHRKVNRTQQEQLTHWTQCWQWTQADSLDTLTQLAESVLDSLKSLDSQQHTLLSLAGSINSAYYDQKVM